MVRKKNTLLLAFFGTGAALFLIRPPMTIPTRPASPELSASELTAVLDGVDRYLGEDVIVANLRTEDRDGRVRVCGETGGKNFVGYLISVTGPIFNVSAFGRDAEVICE